MSANILKKKNLEKYSFFNFIVHFSKAIESNLKYRCEYLNGIVTGTLVLVTKYNKRHVKLISLHVICYYLNKGQDVRYCPTQT